MYRQAAEMDRGKATDADTLMKAQAFEDLIQYIEEGRGIPGLTFEMSVITNLYSKRLKQLGVEYKVHTTRLRQDICAAIPDLVAVQRKNATYELVYDEDLALAVSQMKSTKSSEIAIFAQCTKLLRGYNMAECSTLEDIVANRMSRQYQIQRIFFEMLLKGFQIGDDVIEEDPETEKEMKEAIDTLIEITILNSKTSFSKYNRKNKKSSITRHSVKKIMPNPFYFALKLYQRTRKEEIIDQFYLKGLCISYDKLRSFLIHLANSILSRWSEEDLVFPIQGLKGVFITGM